MLKRPAVWGVIWAAALVSASPLKAAEPAAQASQTVILLTHPRASVLHHYVTLVRSGVLNIPQLRIIGIHHASETEDYSDAQAYLARQKIDWITLRTVDCPLSQKEIFSDNACRAQFADLVARSAGIILNGGPDIPPAIYNKPTSLMTVIETPRRHYFEISLLANMLGTARNRHIEPLLKNRPDYAVMGICVGMQSMNVADGGTLVQDIPSEVYGVSTVEGIVHSSPLTWHRSTHAALDPEPDVTAGVFHPIKLSAKAPDALRLLLLDAPHAAQVLSIHHQAVGKVGKHYVVTATSVDGKVVEGIRHKTFVNVAGWQFHPERSVLWDASEEARVSAEDQARNFAYAVMQDDPKAKSFAMTIWHQFTEALAQSVSHQSQVATH